MTELEILKAELAEIEKRIKAEQEIRGDVMAKLAELCPVKIGDVVEVNGWTFRGKKMLVDDVCYYTRTHRSTTWKCSGPILKADGTPGKNRGEHGV
ncbi:MAG: hypothetical protein GY862_27005 [Gammaproteobacteria bacterium]|nr:hypothetical protein [Gammaproteobacteria bacterium]MCP5013844.1 hypothetical protein [Ketobacter sp.]